MAVGQTQFADLSQDSQTLMKDEMLSIIEKNIVLAQHATKVSLQQHNSKTIQYTRYKRLPLPQSNASEGVTGSSVKLENEILTAFVDQWILTVELTDIAMLTIKHPLVPIVEDRLGTAKAELVEREVYKALLPAPVVFAENKSSRGGLATTSELNAGELRKLWAIMKRNGARSNGRHFILVVDPEQSQDIMADDKFIPSVQFAKAMALFNNEVGEYLGFRVQVSNSLPVLTAIADADITLDTSTSGGAMGAADDFPVKVTAVDDQWGYETVISAILTQTIAGADDTLEVTVPATTGYTYNIYIGGAGDTLDSELFLVETGVAPGATYIHTAAPPTSGINPPATPPMAAGAGTVPVHTAFVFGKEAFGMVNLSGDNLRVLVTGNTPTDSDPAMQRKKISLKGSFKAFIFNEAYIRRIESASSFVI